MTKWRKNLLHVELNLAIDWEPRLQKKVGGSNLAKLDVYYDFDWEEVFPHGRATFLHGLSLAWFARNHCPEGKIPCLLLTTRDDVPEEPIQTDTHYVLVVHIVRYLKTSSADPATTYFAKDTLLHHYLDQATITRWANGEPSRFETLRRVLDTQPRTGESPTPADQHSLVRVICALDEVTPELGDAMVAALSAGGADELRRVAKWLSSNTIGRQAALEALADRIESRITDVRLDLHKFLQLLDDDSRENDLQLFIREHPWLLGLEYVRVRSRQDIPRGELDFLVERHDGYHDLLELKRPDDKIIRCRAEGDEPHPASKYSLAPSLSNALAQVQIYRDQLTRDEASMDANYGIENTGHPRVIIIIGRERDLSRTERRILRHLNLSLHRIEVMPYDWLAKRSEIQLQNLTMIISGSDANAAEDPDATSEIEANASMAHAVHRDSRRDA